MLSAIASCSTVGSRDHHQDGVKEFSYIILEFWDEHLYLELNGKVIANSVLTPEHEDLGLNASGTILTGQNLNVIYKTEDASMSQTFEIGDKDLSILIVPFEPYISIEDEIVYIY